MTPDEQRLSDALAAIDTASTNIAADVTAIGARIADLTNQLAEAGGGGAVVKGLADQAQAEVTKLNTLADQLGTLGKPPATPAA